MTTRPFKDFTDAFSYIRTFTNYEQKTDFHYDKDLFDRTRVRICLANLSNPEEKLRFIHIAGTKGKGSVAMMVSSILRKAGFRVGLFQSPHLFRLQERISIQGEEIPNQIFTEIMNLLYPILEALRNNGNPLTFFEIITVLAIAYFERRKVDYAVLEVGMGGRLDSTNVVSPLVTAITAIGFDHTRYLGRSLSKIAFEKAGIIKPGIPVISGVKQKNPRAVIEDIARMNAAPLFGIEEEFRLMRERDGTFAITTWQKTYDKLTLSLLGEHQKDNAAVAVAIIEASDIDVSYEAVRQGLSHVRLPGRIEVISEKPIIILDTAHNTSSLRALRDTLLHSFDKRKITLLFGIQRDKGIRQCLKAILPVVHRAVFTKTGSPRSAEPEKLIQIARNLGFRDVVSEKEVQNAYERALRSTEEDGVLCIAGSFYLAGEISKLMRKKQTAETFSLSLSEGCKQKC